MNTKSISKAIVSGEKGPRIAGRAILGVILVITFLLTAAIVYSRAATQQVNPVTSAIEAPVAANPELMLTRRSAAEQAHTSNRASQEANPELALAHRYAAGLNSVSNQASLAVNPELILARRFAAVKKPAEATLLEANREQSFARHNGINQGQTSVHADGSDNPELILIRRAGKEIEKTSVEGYLVANPELLLVHRYMATIIQK